MPALTLELKPRGRGAVPHKAMNRFRKRDFAKTNVRRTTKSMRVTREGHGRSEGGVSGAPPGGKGERRKAGGRGPEWCARRKRRSGTTRSHAEARAGRRRYSCVMRRTALDRAALGRHVRPGGAGARLRVRHRRRGNRAFGLRAHPGPASVAMTTGVLAMISSGSGRDAGSGVGERRKRDE